MVEIVEFVLNAKKIAENMIILKRQDKIENKLSNVEEHNRKQIIVNNIFNARLNLIEQQVQELQDDIIREHIGKVQTGISILNEAYMSINPVIIEQMMGLALLKFEEFINTPPPKQMDKQQYNELKALSYWGKYQYYLYHGDRNNMLRQVFESTKVCTYESIMVFPTEFYPEKYLGLIDLKHKIIQEENHYKSIKKSFLYDILNESNNTDSVLAVGIKQILFTMQPVSKHNDYAIYDYMDEYEDLEAEIIKDMECCIEIIKK